MLVPDEDAPHLRTWLLKKLPELFSNGATDTETDTEILADYLLALLSTLEEVTGQVRENMRSELADILEPGDVAGLDDTITSLVDEVLRNVQEKTYLPGARASAQGVSQASGRDLKKRSHREALGDGTVNNGDGYFAEGRAFKQPRRGGIASERRPYSSTRTMDPGPPAGLAGHFNPTAAAFEPGVATLDASHGMWPQVPGHYGTPPPHNPGRKPCRDFQNRGFCTRGQTCKFGHVAQPFPLPHSGAGFNGGPIPEDQLQQMFEMVQQNQQQMQQMMEHFQNSMNGQASAGGRGGSFRRGRRRASLSAEGPVHDQSCTTIVVEGIPQNQLNEEAVRGYFSEFGAITDLSVQPSRRLAVVKYDSWDAANAAYRSPKVIFENRFVKVYWHRENENTKGPDEPEFDLDAFAKKQDEAQRRFEENKQAKADIEKAREEVERKQRDLLVKQGELRSKLHAKEGGAVGTSTSEALRAQLAALEAEAKVLGLDPEADDTTMPSGSYRSRGRGRGRGGRGFYTPRGRGRGLARGSDRHAAYARYSLDNRPTAVAVSGADFTDTSRDEALRQHLLGVAEFTDIEATATHALVTFKDRKTAERFYYGAALENGSIPGVDGKLELTWVAKPAKPATAASKQEDEDAVMTNIQTANAAAPDSSREVKVDLDYEQAEEGEWGIE